MIVYLNGEYVAREKALISVEDRAFLFGDGVYEVIRAVDGGLFAAGPHVTRMTEGLASLGIVLPEGEGVAELLGIAARLLRENGRDQGDATVYLQVTRGSARRTHYFPPADTPPTVYLSSATFTHPEGLHEEGAKAITVPDIRWARCNIKTVNLLPNVLAKQRAVEAGATEALFIRDGVLLEGSSTNAFAVIDGTLRTYPDSNYILPGITRNIILEIAETLAIPVRLSPVLVEEMHRLDELFITGTTTDVLPIVTVDGRPVGSGRPGPLTRRLQEALQQRLTGSAGLSD